MSQVIDLSGLQCMTCGYPITACGHGWTHVDGGHECAIQPRPRVATPRNPIMISDRNIVNTPVGGKINEEKTKMADYGLRDRIVSWLANQILRLASRRYRNMVKGSIKYGLLSAARDERTGALPPLPESCYPSGATPLDTPVGGKINEEK